MKGLISGIKRMEIHDGDGLRSTVFFKGCPLKCLWCHNPESISFEPQNAVFKEKCISCGSCKGVDGSLAAELCPVSANVRYGVEYDVDTLVGTLMKDADYYKNSGGGVTLSGGECLAQAPFATALAKMLKENGISVYIDTCGYVKKEVLDCIIPYTDVFLYDIKAIDPQVHKKCTGKDNAIILDNLRYLSEKDCSIEIRYPLVVGYNDKECEAIGRFLQGLKGIRKIKVLQYHSFAASRYEALGMENTLPDTVTAADDVENAVNLLKSFGLNAVNGIKED